MVESPRFCTNCGAPLQPGTRFCGSCGRPVAAGYPQGTVPPPQVVYQSVPAQPPAAGYPRTVAQPARPRPRIRLGRGGTVLLAIGVLLLLLLLARFVALKAVGKTTIATVTAVEETGGEDYEYRIEYRFVGPDGAIVTGAAVREEMNLGRLPRVGQQVRVRYLPFWPAINELDQ